MARTLTALCCVAISGELPGYCAEDISVGINRPVSVGRVEMTELSRCACASAAVSRPSTSPARNTPDHFAVVGVQRRPVVA